MNFLKLYSDCAIIDGYLNSLIIDFQRGSYVVVPKTLSIVLKKCETQSIDELRKEIDKDSLIHFDSYIDFMLKHEFGFITNIPENYTYFRNKNSNIEEYNLICENHNFILNGNLLGNLNISAIYLRIDKKINIGETSQILNKLIRNDSLTFVSICADYNENIAVDDIKMLGYKYPMIGCLYLYSSPKTKTKVHDEITIEYNSNKYFGFKNCGLISSNYFRCNNKLFTESLHHNSCLHKKISIDVHGNIRNCPAMPESFGNIKDTTLEAALNKPGFKKYWNITKDQIEICKDCEFRYICTDCRAYRENPEDIYSKPLKCGYNPYTAEWEEWSTNPLKQKAIDFYGMREII